MAENVLGALADLQEESKPEPTAETNEAVSSLMKVETPNPTSVLFCGSADFAAAADNAALATFTKLAGLDDHTALQEQQARLSLRRGGMGLRSLHERRSAAWGHGGVLRRNPIFRRQSAYSARVL